MELSYEDELALVLQALEGTPDDLFTPLEESKRKREASRRRRASLARQPGSAAAQALETQVQAMALGAAPSSDASSQPSNVGPLGIPPFVPPCMARAPAAGCSAADPDSCQLHLGFCHLDGDDEAEEPQLVVMGVSDALGEPKSLLATMAQVEAPPARIIEGGRSPLGKLGGDQSGIMQFEQPPGLLEGEWLLDTHTDSFSNFVAANAATLVGGLPPDPFKPGATDGSKVLEALKLVFEGQGEPFRRGSLVAFLEHGPSETPVASFQGAQLYGLSTAQNTVFLHRNLTDGAQLVLPEFFASCHNFSTDDLSAQRHRLHGLLARCGRRDDGIQLFGGDSLPADGVLRYLAVASFVVVSDPRWDSGPAKAYKPPLVQAEGQGSGSSPSNSLPSQEGYAHWDESALQAHRVLLLLDIGGDEARFRILEDPEPLTPVPGPPEGMHCSELLAEPPQADSGSDSTGGAVHLLRPFQY